MSKEESRKVVNRAVMDEEFRLTLYSDPEKALAGYDLSDEEKSVLRSIPAETIDAFANELEERISLSLLALGSEIFSRPDAHDIHRIHPNPKLRMGRLP
jgi:hypothetical protein